MINYINARDLLISEYSSYCLSNFEECSVNDVTGLPLVHNRTTCFNFDKIKASIDSTKKSADSLFNCDSKELFLFIEFKDSTARNSNVNVYCSAADSLFLFNSFFKNKLNEEEDLKKEFAAILSSNKNGSNETNTITAALIRQSSKFGYFSVDTVDSEQCYKDRLKREYPFLYNEKHFFSKYIFVLSDNFDEWILEYN